MIRKALAAWFVISVKIGQILDEMLEMHKVCMMMKEREYRYFARIQISTWFWLMVKRNKIMKTSGRTEIYNFSSADARRTCYCHMFVSTMHNYKRLIEIGDLSGTNEDSQWFIGPIQEPNPEVIASVYTTRWIPGALSAIGERQNQ